MNTHKSAPVRQYRGKEATKLTRLTLNSNQASIYIVHHAAHFVNR